jgi:chromosome segregation ATPase
MIGDLAGFAVVLRASALEHTELVLKGANLYSASISDSAHGTTRSLEHAVQSLDQKLAQTEKDVAESRKRMAELEAKVGEPFEHEAKLKSLTERQDEIVKALDLTRNQASNKLDASSPSDTEEAVSEKVGRSVRHQVQQSHRATVH